MFILINLTILGIDLKNMKFYVTFEQFFLHINGCLRFSFNLNLSEVQSLDS